MSFAKEAWTLVLPCVLLALAFSLVHWTGPAIGVFFLALSILFFFRVPRRNCARGHEGVLSPANGRVTKIDEIEDPLIGSGRFHRVVVFLSVFDVHVQRAPVAGRVVRSQYKSGLKVAAFRADAGEVNEQVLTVFERANGDLVAMRQIAGLIARRVVTYLEVGRKVAQGELVGLIKFGSRVDLLIPSSYDLEISVGQRLQEGSTLVARDAEGNAS